MYGVLPPKCRYMIPPLRMDDMLLECQEFENHDGPHMFILNTDEYKLTVQLEEKKNDYAA